MVVALNKRTNIGTLFMQTSNNKVLLNGKRVGVGLLLIIIVPNCIVCVF